MPFKSRTQARYLFAAKPAIAKEFAKKTSDMKHLPEHAKRAKQMMALKKKVKK